MPNENKDSGEDSIQVGAAIKKLRTRKKLSLNELSVRSGVSVGMLSQIERDMTSPSIRTLSRIRLALRVPMSALFSEMSSDFGDPEFLRRMERRPRLRVGPGGMVKEMLSPSTAKHMEFMILHIPPNGSSGEQPAAYAAEKGGMVLKGEVALKIGSEEAHLMEGDSFQFDGLIPHSFINASSTEEAQLLWFIVQSTEEPHL